MTEPTVTVVGAGALGSSLAFHLTAAGAKVTVLDPHGIAGETTQRAAGQCMHVHSSDELSRVGIRSIEMFERFPDQVGRHLDYVVSGSIKVARSPEFMPQLDDEVARGHAYGVEIDFIDHDEARRLAPWFEPRDGSKMWFTPGDRYFEFPDSVSRAYLSAATERGAKLRLRTARGLDGKGGVVTEDGIVHGDVVVVAAGAWTRSLLAPLYPDTPVWPVRHQILITDPLPSVHRHQPSVRVIEAKTYTRPHLGGLMIGGYESEPWSPDAPAEVDSVASIPASEPALRSLIDRIADEIPSLVGAPLGEIRAGLPTMTPDGHFVIDRLPLESATYVMSGDTVAGFSPAPALGADLAHWILTGERPEDLASFGIDRFEKAYNDTQMRSAAIAMYVDKYSYAELQVH